MHPQVVKRHSENLRWCGIPFPAQHSQEGRNAQTQPQPPPPTEPRSDVETCATNRLPPLRHQQTASVALHEGPPRSNFRGPEPCHLPLRARPAEMYDRPAMIANPLPALTRPAAAHSDAKATVAYAYWPVPQYGRTIFPTNESLATPRSSLQRPARCQHVSHVRRPAAAQRQPFGILPPAL